MKKELQELFESYKFTKHIAAEIIVSRGFVYSEINPNAEILICGINPSLRTDFLKTSFSYDFDLVKASDRYFKKFQPLINTAVLEVGYFDLFYQKHSKQKDIESFYKTEQGRSFLQSQLNITREILLNLKPKAILVFNKEAFSFFGIHPRLNIGMKFNLENHSIDNTFYCEELNALIYKARYLNHFVNQETLKKMKDDIQLIIKELS